MKDLHADKRALNTALINANTQVNNCEGAIRYIIKEDSRYIVTKKECECLYKVEFKGGKINVVDPKKEEQKAKKAAKKLSRELPDVTDEATD